MRILPGGPVTVAQESVTSKLLIDMGISDPDFMPTIYRLFPEVSPLNYLLDIKGFKTKGVSLATNYNLDGGNYRTVSNNHVIFKIAENDRRKEHIASRSDGLTFLSDAYATKPGYRKTTFWIFLDSNWVGGNEIILLADGKTQVYMIDQKGGIEETGGVWKYECKLIGNSLDEYVDPDLLLEGMEVQLSMSAYPQDFSTGGNERHTFAGYGHSYLTLQRFKLSYSGTAAAMDKNNKNVTGYWVSSNSKNTNNAFLPEAHMKMLKEAARFNEFALMEGKTTVDADTQKVTLTNKLNQVIETGSGVLYSGDGAIEFPINDKWTPKLIESLMADTDSYMRPDSDGNVEAAMFLHPTSYLNFQTAMKEMGVTTDSNIIGVGNEKIINNTYKGYSLGGVTLYAHRHIAYQDRPGIDLIDGSKSNQWDGLIIPLGNTQTGRRGIELIQLRGMVQGKVQGIDAGGNISSDIDGSSEHVLIQNGVVSQIQPIILYKPWKNNRL